MRTAGLVFFVAYFLIGSPLSSRISGQTPHQSFFQWTDVAFPVDEYAQRRRSVLKRLKEAGGGVLLVPSRDSTTHGATFRQLDDFLYFTGLELPDSMLMLDADAGRATLLVPAMDRRFQHPARRNDFPGRPLLRDQELSRRSGINDLRNVNTLGDALAGLAKANRRVHIGLTPGVNPAEINPPMVGSLASGSSLALRLRTAHPELSITNAHRVIATSRMTKSPREIELLRRAADVTARGIRAAAARVAPGIDERGLEGVFEEACKAHGAQRLAFDSIVKSGPNALWPWRILASHYDRRNRRMKDGEVVILDVGCEVDHYVSDVGRTFPVGGRFNTRQRELVEMVRAVSDAVISAVKPGVTFADLRRAANAAIPKPERRFMQTGLFYGHHIGLAVGDPNLPDAGLEPGMTFTVEPWYYNHKEGVAVFIEDVVVVTEQGCENLTAHLPRTADGLEDLVAGAAPRRQVRVLAYNIHHGAGLDKKLDLERISRVINDARPDVVALQEVDDGCERTDSVNQIKELARLTKMRPAFGPFFDYQGGRYGMALLSRHPISEVRNIRLPKGAEPRTALAATVTIDGRAFVLCGIHFYRTTRERVAQATALLQALASESRPVVLTGDFNSPPQGPVMTALSGRFERVRKSSRPRATFPSPLPVSHIDHTLIPRVGPLRAISCTVLDERVASDHRPIMTVLEWIK